MKGSRSSGAEIKTCCRGDGPLSPGSTDVTNFLMTEARQQNTEIRLSIGKVVDKVDQLTSKVCRGVSCPAAEMIADWLITDSLLLVFWQIDDLQKQASLSVGVASMPMETSIILHNIQRIVQVSNHRQRGLA